jgi:tRNA-dihydrouridine synthase A
MPFIEKELQDGIALNHITRHILGLFHGCAGARQWRRLISEEAHKPRAGPELIQRAAGHVRSSQLPFQS